ncbi:MAG: prepilin-type N-terminal cleavage/methylation domain-containing protein [Limnothrix sp. RL_2_0]|nr:prepilin-type N-terminal cleavage/methylation domain-containing protein [Limnothrix sp. RL_2_0]
MKNFSFKLLQQLNQKKADKGFTLIELLVVIIIIGILSAIALPAFLNQANKARQSEAKQALGAINRGQQAYYLEKQLFSSNVFGLGLGLQLATENYSYGNAAVQAGMTSDRGLALPGVGRTTGGGLGSQETTTAPGQTATACAATGGYNCMDDRQGFDGYASFSVVWAVAENQEAVRDYMGVAMLVPGDPTSTSEATTIAVLCEEEDLKGTIPNPVTIDGVDLATLAAGSMGPEAYAEMTDMIATGEASCRGTVAADNDAIVGQNAQNVGQ